VDQDIACVPAVSRRGIPLGCEGFAGNHNDVTTLEEIVETMERRYGCADRICVMDRGVVCFVAGGSSFVAGRSSLSQRARSKLPK